MTDCRDSPNDIRCLSGDALTRRSGRPATISHRLMASAVSLRLCRRPAGQVVARIANVGLAIANSSGKPRSCGTLDDV